MVRDMLAFCAKGDTGLCADMRVRRSNRVWTRTIAPPGIAVVAPCGDRWTRVCGVEGRPDRL